jgi:hypothetical protein
LREVMRRLQTEVTNLTKAIALGGDIPQLVKMLAAKDKELKAIEARIANPIVIPEREELRQVLERRAGDWRTILRSKHVEQTRLVLQHLIDLPIKVPNEPMPRWLATMKPEGLTVGLIQSGTSPTGVVREWTRPVPGEVPAGSGTGKAA